ncbi:multiple epidermal growth factor-like domains protein 6 [Pomacea canaliculata]|uniref:multiple epidermal growth factor-like domains protein 6 n=1 Tax=Pomacea canaliculata TaxID=400727 RepID=UPI000D734B70|nr:multiple epidermal growth factor-like domains protein 6 [Pomacea canaliculata]
MWQSMAWLWLLVAARLEVQGHTCTCEATGGCNFTEACVPADNCRKGNVALGKAARLSSVYDTNEVSGPACLAVNGNRDETFRPINQFPDSPNCVHTGYGDLSPFWEVDLGQDFLITSITVIGRNTQITRMRSMKLNVDNQEIYTFPSDNALLKTEISLPVPVRGRRVRLSKKSQAGNDMFLNLCEVQVWECVEGYFGPDCNKTCGACRYNSVCDTVTKACPAGCESGWQGPRCDQTCAAGTYGRDCKLQCGHCRRSVHCDHVNGTCKLGCVDGFQGKLCRQVCDEGYFGPNCSRKCGGCKNNAPCDTETGNCPDDCDTGWQGSRCDQSQTCSCEVTGGCNFTESCIPAGNCRKRNVALGRTATMGSVPDDSNLNETSGPACLAVNGNSDVTYSPFSRFPASPNCVHIASGNFSSPFWEVDLGQEFPIAAVTLMVPPLDRLFRVYSILLGSHIEEIYIRNAAARQDARLDKVIVSHKVRLSLAKGYGYFDVEDLSLSLCEVQVWVCVDGYFGINCNKKCGACRNNWTCDAVTGYCPANCEPGWQGFRCDQTCAEGYFGPDCAKTCGSCKNSSVCDSILGNCPAGCESGWRGPTCNQTEENENLTALVAGLAVGGIVMFIVVAVGIFWRCKLSSGSDDVVAGYSSRQIESPVYDNQGDEQRVYEVISNTPEGVYEDIAQREVIDKHLRRPAEDMDTNDVYVNIV